MNEKEFIREWLVETRSYYEGWQNGETEGFWSGFFFGISVFGLFIALLWGLFI